VKAIIRTKTAPKSVSKSRFIVSTPTLSSKKTSVIQGLQFTPGQSSTASSVMSTLRSSALSSALKSTKSEQSELDWADKQCAAFAQWLNYMFQPSEDRDHETTLLSLEEEGQSTKSMDRSALRTLILHRRIAQARTKALAIHSGEEMRKAHRIIVSEIGRGRLALRPDRDLFADLTLRDQITSLLLSYSTPWLRLGLEAVFGEPINAEVPNHFSPQKIPTIKSTSRKPSKPPLSRMRQSLKNFLVTRLLSDPSLLMKYTKGLCKVPSGNFEKKYLAESRMLTLSRLLDLIFFLDKAKMENVLHLVPRLFVKDSKVKSSRDVLVAVCRDFLSQEGDITKHLARIGLKVHYSQQPIDEIDYSIDNLAVDIRDGVRLARMTEILSNRAPKSLLVTLRLPAVSRLQKLHNVGAALEALHNSGVQGVLQIAAHHIVDGHREMVLKLMWAVVSFRGLRALMDPSEIQDEIDSVLRSNKTRRTIWQFAESGKKIRDEATRRRVDESDTSDAFIFESLLLRWCNAICATFGITVLDLSSSFADGIVPCLLVHYYHPGLLPLTDILPTTRHLHMRVSYADALRNERSNTALALATLAELGGIPQMLPVGDSENPPEEKSMVLFVTYLCSRLMESSKEILACILIQSYYRRMKRIGLLKMKMSAASFLWRTWSLRKEIYFRNQRNSFVGPVGIIEDFICSHKHMLKFLRHRRVVEEERHAAVTLIQCITRRWLIRNQILPILYRARSARIIQSLWRMFAAKQQVNALLVDRSASITIQRLWRGHLVRDYFIDAYVSVIAIQALARGHSARREIETLRFAAIQMQRVWRGFSAALQYQVSLLDVIAVQSLARRNAAISFRKKCLKATATLQLTFRWFLSIRSLKARRVETAERARKETAAMQIQRLIRKAQARRCFKVMLGHAISAKLIQSVWRRKSEQDSYHSTRSKCILLQSICRGFLAKDQIKALRACAIVIQAKWRVYLAARSFRQSITAIVRLQSCARSYLCSTRAMSDKIAIQIVQCVARRRFACGQARVLRHQKLLSASTIKIQSSWRCYQARSAFAILQFSVQRVQAFYRGVLVRREMKALSFFTTVIQKQWRRYWTKLQYQFERLDILRVQSVFRRRASVVEVARRVNAIMRIQHRARMFLALSRSASMKEKIDACVAIQSRWKAFHASITYMRSRCAVLRLQPVVRGYLGRHHTARRLESVVQIQANWRRFICTIDFRLSIVDVIVVQSMVRRYLVKASVVRCHKNSILLQCFIRSCIARGRAGIVRARRVEVAKEKHVKKNTATVIMQAYFRGYFVRKDARALGVSATTIQACWRSYTTLIQFRVNLVDIIVIQSLFRRWRVRKQHLRLNAAAVLLQKSVRRFFASALVGSLLMAKDLDQQEHRSAISIQRIARGTTAQKSFRRHKAAKMIQKTWRCYTIHVDFMLAMISSIMIQSAVRRWRSYDDFHIARYGVIQFQAMARGAAQRRKQSATISGIVSLQSLVRGMLVRYMRRHLDVTASIMQKVVRGFLCRVEIEIQNFAAVEIQKVWRGYSANVDFMVAAISAIKIQSIVRQRTARSIAHGLRWAQVLVKAELLFKEKQVVKIQRTFRAHLRLLRTACFVATIQRSARKYLARKKRRHTMNAIVMVQSHLRAHLIRLSRPITTKRVAERVIQATFRARQDPSMRLGERTNAALLVLQRSKRLSEIMVATTTLETCTRLSRKCCVAFAEAAAPGILYNLIRTCNRSLPHIELLHYVLQTLRNVANHPDLVGMVATASSAEIYMDLVQMFRDKDTVFTLAIGLLEIVVHSSMELHEQCATKENLKRLKGVHSLCVRKMTCTSRVSAVATPGHVAASKRSSSSLRNRENVDRKLGVHVLRGIISRLEMH
jgi:abnormal spindle-like microcephaly-associated protein